MSRYFAEKLVYKTPTNIFAVAFEHTRQFWVNQGFAGEQI